MTIDVGDTVKLRGREPRGTVISLTNEDEWVRVDWDQGHLPGPTLVHVLELERVSAEKQGGGGLQN